MAWILHYLFQQINFRPDQPIKYRDNIDLSGAICQLQMPAVPSRLGSRRMLLFTSWNTHYEYLSLQPRLSFFIKYPFISPLKKEHEEQLLLWRTCRSISGVSRSWDVMGVTFWACLLSVCVSLLCISSFIPCYNWVFRLACWLMDWRKPVIFI